LRFVHAADLHLDSPFTGLMDVEDSVGAVLREATFDAYNSIIDLCIRERVDALLVAGDVYDGADRSLRAQIKFVAGLKRLSDEGIRSFICHGNHDPLDGWEARLSLPERCHRFGPDVQVVPLDPDDPGKATVYGVSYPKRDVHENLVPRFQPVSNGGFAIGLLHCNVGSNTGHESYAPCTLDDLARAGMDYWALGHVHNHQVLRDEGPAVVYPGNPQGRHPGETGARGVYLVDVNEAGRVSLQFRPMDVVRWASIDVSIDSMENVQQLLNGVAGRVSELVDGAEGRHVVFRAEVGGRGPLHHALRRQGFADDLRLQINDDWSRQTPFAWCERVRVDTRSAIDRDERCQGADFVAELLRVVDDVRGDPQAIAGLSEDLQVLYNHGKVRRHLKDLAPSGEDLLALLQEAETICLEELVGEETP